MTDQGDLIGRIRSFNRFYTRLIGLLDRHFLESLFSLTEARVLYEIRHGRDCSAKKIRAAMDIDEGYLSRIIDSFQRRGLVRKSPSPEDKRLHIIELTRKGMGAFQKLDERSHGSVAGIVERLPERERGELVRLMERIRELLSGVEEDVGKETDG